MTYSAAKLIMALRRERERNNLHSLKEHTFFFYGHKLQC